MKILFCTNVFQIVENGPVKFAQSLVAAYARFPQHEIRVLSEDLATEKPGFHKVHLPKLGAQSPFSQFLRMWMYHQKAMEIRKRYAFDVLVYNHALVGLLSVFRFPSTIVMLNDYKNVDGTLSRLRLSRTWLKRFIFRIAESVTLRRANKIIVNSEYLKNRIIQDYSLDPGKVFRIYKGVERIEAPTLHTALHQPLRVLFVKNDYLTGGLPVLIKALSRLGIDIELGVAGTDDRADRAIRRLIPTDATVTLLLFHKVTPEVVREKMRWCDIFCVPSRKESLGLANLEAMATCRPVISTHVGGIPEVLDYGKCGWMVPPGNVEALIKAFQMCITDSNLRNEKVRYALQHVQHFSHEEMLSQFFRLCEQ
jgi:colanic acid/amylovoran biosynthesis glycosyltransferase